MGIPDHLTCLLRNLRVRAFPVIEKNHWIWIWLGDPAKADPALVEDFHWLDDSGWGFGGNYLHVEANYLLLVENLLDTTHLPFLHPSTLGTDAFAKSEFEVTREGDRIKVARWLMDKPPAPFHKQMGGFPDGMSVDRWQIALYRVLAQASHQLALPRVLHRARPRPPRRGANAPRSARPRL